MTSEGKKGRKGKLRDSFLQICEWLLCERATGLVLPHNWVSQRNKQSFPKMLEAGPGEGKSTQHKWGAHKAGVVLKQQFSPSVLEEERWWAASVFRTCNR